MAGILENDVRKELGYMERDISKYQEAFETHRMVYGENEIWQINTLYYNGDEMVARTQEWLNETYGKDSRFKNVEVDGRTGWSVIYGLRRALQIEVGITETGDGFGKKTIAGLNKKFPNGVKQQENGAVEVSNVYSIIQGALWCKGYSSGSAVITNHFYEGTAKGVRSLKTDAGLISPNSTVTLNVMSALLSMNQYVAVKSQGGSEKFREIQQGLNRGYEKYIGLAPCDGIYGRDMNKALIMALQATEGLCVEEVQAAEGAFGDKTKKKCLVVPDAVSSGAEIG